MPDFFAILAFYYASDSAAMSGALKREQRVYCSDIYERIKILFLTEQELAGLDGLPITERSLRIRKGYLRFKNWERNNPDIVACLKRKAVGQLI